MMSNSNESSLIPIEPSLQIELINPNSVYELNDLINGILTLELNRTINSKCIIIKLKCFGEVKWLLPSDTEPDQCIKERENFLNTNYNVEKNYKSICESGFLHKIPFQFQLTDKRLPPSFEENNGFICYYITASIIDDQTNELIIKTPPHYITVRIGLIRNDLLLSIGSSVHREFGTFCFKKKDKIQIYVYISKKGFCRGDKVPIEIHIINKSSHKINSNIILYQTKCFNCKNRQHIVEHHFEEINGSTVLKGSDIKETIYLLIPDNCIVSFKTNIIIVSYFIHLSFKLVKTSIDLHLNLPIIITTRKCINEIE